MRGASSATGTSCIASHFQGAAINGAIAAIDIALRDIKGKALGVPVHSLLDGPCRTEARVYGHAYGRMIAELVANCTALKEAGFNAVDHVNPFLDEGEDRPFFRTHVRNMTRAVEAVRRVREALGDDVDLLLELHRRLTPAEAVGFIPRIERYLPFWCEDPSRPENVNAMARVARRVRAPIARRASATPPCTTSAPSSRGAGPRSTRASTWRSAAASPARGRSRRWPRRSTSRWRRTIRFRRSASRPASTWLPPFPTSRSRNTPPASRR